MKKRIFLSLWGIILLFQSVSLTAQTQISENYLISGPFTDYVAPMKYSYTVSDEGERVMNGPISISGRQNETYGNVTITGNYVLNAAAKNGNLNGSMSVKANYHGVKQLFRGQEVEDYAYSFSGSFINGVPNGTFTAKATNFGSSTVTYKQGVLVGSYYVDEIIDDRILTIKGSFNDSGKMVGVWDIKKFGDTEVWEFVNGVRVRISSKQSESTPKQIEMAKKYASGAITNEALEEEGYFPVQDSIALGDYSSDLYFLKFIVDWEKMPNCSFKKGLWVKYSYLYNLLPLPESEFEKILTNYKENGVAPLPVDIDETTKCYTTHYYVNYGSPSVKLIERSFSNEQVAKVKDALDYYCRKNPIPFKDLFTDYDLRRKATEISLKYDEFKSLPIAKKYDSLIKDINELTEAAKERLGGEELTSDGLFYIVPSDDRRQPLSVCYLPVSSLDELLSIEIEATDLYCRSNPIALSDLLKQQNINPGIRDKALNMRIRFEDLKKEEDIELAFQKYESLIKDADDVSRTIIEQLDGKEMTSDGKFYIIPSKSASQTLPSYFEVSALNRFKATEKEIRDYRVTLNRLIEEMVAQNMVSALNGIQKQSKSKLTKLLHNIAVNKEPEYFTKVSYENTVSIEEFAEAIAPVIEYEIQSVQREIINNSNSYRATILFKKKQKKEEIVVPVSMSVTEKGAKIIDKTITLVSQ